VDQALAVLKAAEDDRLRAYFVLSLLTGVRTEEARALRWDHVHLNARGRTSRCGCLCGQVATSRPGLQALAGAARACR